MISNISLPGLDRTIIILDGNHSYILIKYKNVFDKAK